jgi:hypothetical protein
MSIASLDTPIRLNLIDAAVVAPSRVPRLWCALALAGVLSAAGYQACLALQSPAQLIRGELRAAAAETAALPWNRTPDQVRAVVARHFEGRDVSIDATKFPAVVAVTLQGVDRATCQEAQSLARRIEGSVVIALDGAQPCAAANVMRWRIMP